MTNFDKHHSRASYSALTVDLSEGNVRAKLAAWTDSGIKFRISPSILPILLRSLLHMNIILIGTESLD